jgi:hypothetical protein
VNYFYYRSVYLNCWSIYFVGEKGDVGSIYHLIYIPFPLGRASHESLLNMALRVGSRRQ